MKKIIVAMLLVTSLAACSQTTADTGATNCDKTDTACLNSKYRIHAVKLPPTVTP